MKPLVSIITPSFNQADFLRDTIESVLNQDYPSIEYIIVDGGSSDGSQEIIKSYSDRLSWWISEPDQGQADAINKGFQRAQGEIITWLNSDDMYLPRTISKVVNVFQNKPDAGMIYGDAVSSDKDGRLLNELRFDSWHLKELLEFNIICQPAVFMKRSILERSGYLDLSYHFFLDHQLWIRIARETNLVHQPQIWAVSRYHDRAKNVTMISQVGEEAYRILDWAAAEPDLANIIDKNHRRIWAGAHQINARYLLDGGLSFQAFKKYIQAAWIWFPSITGYWHRFIFSGLSTMGLGFLGKMYYHLKRSRSKYILQDVDLTGWQGIRSS